MSEIEPRRPYSDLNEVEQEIVEHALPRETINREEIIEKLSEKYSEQAAEEAFTELKQENRLFRRGNKTIYVMIRRDLF